MIIQKTINEVLNTVKIEEVVGDFVNLKRRGVNLIGNCPFHDEILELKLGSKEIVLKG